VARLAAYRNVWWSMANEYDFLLDVKPMSQWDHYFHILEEKDPYQHLRSNHNGDVTMNYDHTKPWITHVCIQNWDVKRVSKNGVMLTVNLLSMMNVNMKAIFRAPGVISAPKNWFTVFGL
jgi:hypothetical protein